MPSPFLPISDVPIDHKFARGTHSNENLGDAGGCNAGVIMVRRRKDGLKCVEKKMKPSFIRAGRAKEEINFLRGLNHPNINRYVDAFLDDNPTAPRASLYTEYCNRGSLQDRIDYKAETGGFFSESVVVLLLTNLVNAIAYCQYGTKDAYRRQPTQPGWVAILHRDIKPDNVFIQMDEPGGKPRYILGDFGLAQRYSRTPPRSSHYGTPTWCPPENPYHGKRSDVWSIGAIIQSVCHLGLSPCHSVHGVKPCCGVGTRYTPELDAVVRRMMRTIPENRPDILTVSDMLHDIPFAR